MPTTITSDSTASTVELYYQDSGGTGRPVVLIHGWPLSCAAFTDNVGALEAAGYRVVAYDRRGFGQSQKPLTGYDYDQLADDLAGLLTDLDLRDVTLVGFSMGGGEVARYIARHGEERLHSVVFASAVPPYMLHTGDNPDGPLPKTEAAKMTAALTADQDSFYDDFTTKFFTAGDDLMVTEAQRQEAVALCEQAAKPAALEAMAAFATTDFRDDLAKIAVPTLILHGAADGVVPFEGSGARTHAAVASSSVRVIPGAPHGVNVSHPDAWNSALVDFLGR